AFRSPKVGGSDNCPGISNASQADGDGDGVGDACDNCPTVANASQQDTGTTGTGDVCRFAPAPVGVSATGGTGQISLAWGAGTNTWGTTNYAVLKSSIHLGPYTQESTTSSTSAISSGLASGTTYYYVISASNQ